MAKASFHNCGKVANWVSFGLVSQIAAIAMIIVAMRGFFSGSVMTIGSSA